MRILVGIGMAAIVALSALYAFSPRHTPPLAASQIPVGRMQFNAVVRAGNTLVAGGELGYIMWSDNDGRTWQPASVEPRRYALITDIVFQDDKNGMALAHEGQILRTADGGRSWKELRFDEERGEPLMSIARLPSGHWPSSCAPGRPPRPTSLPAARGPAAGAAPRAATTRPACRCSRQRRQRRGQCRCSEARADQKAEG